MTGHFVEGAGDLAPSYRVTTLLTIIVNRWLFRDVRIQSLAALAEFVLLQLRHAVSRDPHDAFSQTALPESNWGLSHFALRPKMYVAELLADNKTPKLQGTEFNNCPLCSS